MKTTMQGAMLWKECIVANVMFLMPPYALISLGGTLIILALRISDTLRCTTSEVNSVLDLFPRSLSLLDANYFGIMETYKQI